MMSKLINPAIKLFGKTISLPPNKAKATATATAGDDDYVHHHEQESSSSASTENKSTSGEDFVPGIKDLDPANPTEDELVERETASSGSETLQTLVASSDGLSPKDTTLKKPEKILQCPRCSSMDTKFCYYNNYNVKQPRHFCKSCQRFWTAGGSMRNVAVGSGRRKNKGNCPNSPDLPKRPELLHSAQGYGPQIYCFSEGAWPSHRNSTFPSSFAVNFYPANPYYISAVPSPWSTPSLPSPNQSMTSTNPHSPLGKHLRDGYLMQSNLIPNKATKIDGSIGSVKEGNADSFNGSCHFKAFYPIQDGKNHVADNSVILQANPAAFSRSMNFHERS